MSELPPATVARIVRRAARRQCGRSEELDDFGQEIWLAMIEGRLDISELYERATMRKFFIETRFRMGLDKKDHFSIFDIMPGTRGLLFADVVAARVESSLYDEIASSIAAKEWHHGQFGDRTRYTDSLKTFTPPTQFEAARKGQIARAQRKLQELGEFLTLEEVEAMLDAACSNGDNAREK